jgi:pimeloyl-ACP methyl ester carboxylesterase
MEFTPPRFVEVAARRLAYEEATPDDPQGTVLLLCGIGAKRQGWYKQLLVLGERFRAIALDYRDVGDSDAATEQYSISDLAQDVYALAGELGIERASLVGVSMGGFIALELALAYPKSMHGTEARPIEPGAMQPCRACEVSDAPPRYPYGSAGRRTLLRRRTALLPMDEGHSASTCGCPRRTSHFYVARGATIRRVGPNCACRVVRSTGGADFPAQTGYQARFESSSFED